MKYRLSLAQKLTASIAGAVAVQIIFVIVAYLSYFEPRLSNTTDEVIAEGTLGNAQSFASIWSDEVRLSPANGADGEAKNPRLQANIKSVLAENRNIAGISIYRLPDGQAKNTDGEKSFSPPRLIAQQNRAGARYKIDLKRMGRMDKPVTFFSGSTVFAGTPVSVNENTIGYIIFVRSIKEFRGEHQYFKYGMLIVMALFFSMQLAVVFILGNKAGKPVSQLADTAIRIAGGDLTQSVNTPKGAVTEVYRLSMAVKGMSSAIHQQVGQIKMLTGAATEVSQRLNLTMNQLSSSAEEQASAVAETAATVAELEITGKSMVDGVRSIVAAANRSTEVSGRGRTAVQTANDIILKIKEESANISTQSRSLLAAVEEVGNVISSVNSIADQSKILAVNASIEAANAGRFGSGFAVVAQEVQNLAGQSQAATEQITRTLRSIHQSVETMVQYSKSGEERTIQGVSSIASAGNIVNDLSDAIKEASGVADEIKSAVKQQSAGLSQIATAMHEINSSALVNQNISRDMKKGTVSLTENLEQLRLLVEKWATV